MSKFEEIKNTPDQKLAREITKFIERTTRSIKAENEEGGKIKNLNDYNISQELMKDVGEKIEEMRKKINADLTLNSILEPALTDLFKEFGGIIPEAMKNVYLDSLIANLVDELKKDAELDIENIERNEIFINKMHDLKRQGMSLEKENHQFIISRIKELLKI
ncbi:MAG: hypothetical protein AAB465_02590 [Patescibacteria group bacterium]